MRALTRVHTRMYTLAHACAHMHTHSACAHMHCTYTYARAQVYIFAHMPPLKTRKHNQEVLMSSTLELWLKLCLKINQTYHKNIKCSITPPPHHPPLINCNSVRRLCDPLEFLVSNTTVTLYEYQDHSNCYQNAKLRGLSVSRCLNTRHRLP